MNSFFRTVVASLEALDMDAIYRTIIELLVLKDRGGRLFIIGNGGGAAHAGHAAADFRTLCGIEAYCPSDSAASVTALTNDCGWKDGYQLWLQQSRLTVNDALLVISVGGGDDRRNVSPNIVNAVILAQEHGCPILGIVGRDGGFTATAATACIIIPCDRMEWVTPVVEGVQAIVLHAIVADPRLATHRAKWESLDAE